MTLTGARDPPRGLGNGTSWDVGLSGRPSLWKRVVFSVPLNTSRGVELVSASALFLLLLLNLILIGRQDRLKRQEVERRLRGIIDQIQGEAEGQFSLEERCPVTC